MYRNLFLLLFITSFNSIAQENNGDCEIIIENIGENINTNNSEYGSVITLDGNKIFYTSKVPTTIKKEEIKLERVLVSEKINGEWSTGELLPEIINTKNNHSSIIGISGNGQKMLLYRSDKNGNGDIYESILSGDKWSEPKALPTPINSSAHESSASISNDGNTIYFVSNREGGFGGRDIYSCSKDEDGNWQQAINLGVNVNSEKDEEGVFIHADNQTLYFSSKGHKSNGGYDIYFSKVENNKWQKPKNLGQPINTTEDELFFVTTAKKDIAFYTSSRSGGLGKKDIYKVNLCAEKKQSIVVFKGKIFDKETNQPIEAEIEIVTSLNPPDNITTKSNSSTGEFMTSIAKAKSFVISIKSKNYLPFTESVTLDDELEVYKDIYLSPASKGNKLVLNNIFFEYDKAVLKEESEKELLRLKTFLEENKKVKIEIAGHTDNIGSQQYNQPLSEKRAKAVYEYLINNGISSSRLQYQGYGLKKPIASNENEEGRQENRRVEIEVL